MAVDVTKPTEQDDITLQELDLYHAIMAYRADLRLPAIRLSKALSTTAGRHVEDTRENIWRERLDLPADANLHSWSDAFYFEDHRNPEAMWEAPERVGTGYTAPGYEISAAGFTTVEAALEGWRGSASHNAVLAETGIWADAEFLAIGIGVDTSPGAGIYDGRIFHVWFGEAADDAVPTVGGTGDADEIEGTDFEDIINGLGGDDLTRGGRGDDVLRGGGGADRLSGDAGDDALAGNSGDDRLFGGSGDDRLAGIEGDDRLMGGPGDDRLDGGNGDDILAGGGDRDLLVGGEGRDIFLFATMEETGSGSARAIVGDFETDRDLIDVSGIDADASTGRDEPFTFIKGREFRGEAGQLRQSDNYIEGDVDGDGRADFAIQLRRTTFMDEDAGGDPIEVTDFPTLSASDFVL